MLTQIYKKFISYAILCLLIVLAACVSIESGVPGNTSDYKDAVITLERTACYGTCPIYTVTIYGDGRVDYDGDQFVDVPGVQTAQIEPKIVVELVEFMLNNGYLELEDAYTDYKITDMPSVITSLMVNGQSKRIEHYFGDDSAPLILRQIENRIDEVADSPQWTGSPIENTEVVFGSIMVRNEGDKVALPAGATITVRLEDISLADAPSVVIGEQVMTEISQLPAFYDIAYDLTTIDANVMYAVSAEITDANSKLLYWNDTNHSALTYGNGNMIDIEMVFLE